MCATDYFFYSVVISFCNRDSKFYEEQSDVFQFMTPSMLVKIKELRTKKKSIFIIATNYEDRIDKAIKRTGRIDNKFLILPQNKTARLKIVENQFDEKWSGKKGKKEEKEQQMEFRAKIDMKEFDLFLNKTCLMCFSELCDAVKEVLNKQKFRDENELYGAFNKASENLESTLIELKSYESRFNKGDLRFKGNQEPHKEFLLLLWLKLESIKEKEEKEELIKEINAVLNIIFTDKTDEGIIKALKKHLPLFEYEKVRLTLFNFVKE